ncbi:MAG: hypothetical protein KH296_08905 [Ruminococcus sp.]|jgi:hypothetical protein|nr:hypothetical protein [Ruminococcus sp.]
MEGKNMGMNAKFYITMDIGENRGAFSKARHDIEIVLEKKGYKKIVVENPTNKTNKSFLREMVIGMKSWIEIVFSIPNGAILVFQHPMPFSLVSYFMIPVLKLIKKVKVICVIHDIYSFRDKKGKFKFYYRIKDIGLLNRCDKVISHNNRMSAKLIECGVKKENLIPLEIFDYILKDEEYTQRKDVLPDKGIMIAGNLSGEKAHYLDLLGFLQSNVKFLLYGPNFNANLYKDKINVVYKGAFKPEALPKVMDGSYGLVWDGDTLDECSGNIGEYLKINNPHKTSLYLASGFPIIAWRKAAVSDVVCKYKVGVLIESLNDLEILNSITYEQYSEMAKNVDALGHMIRNGMFFEKALLEAEKKLYEEK